MLECRSPTGPSLAIGSEGQGVPDVGGDRTRSSERRGRPTPGDPAVRRAPVRAQGVGATRMSAIVSAVGVIGPASTSTVPPAGTTGDVRALIEAARLPCLTPIQSLARCAIAVARSEPARTGAFGYTAVRVEPQWHSVFSPCSQP